MENEATVSRVRYRAVKKLSKSDQVRVTFLSLKVLFPAQHPQFEVEVLRLIYTTLKCFGTVGRFRGNKRETEQNSNLSVEQQPLIIETTAKYCPCYIESIIHQGRH